MTLPTDPVEAVAQAFAEAPKHRDIADARASIDAESLAMAEAMIAKLTALGWESPEDVALLHAIKAQFEEQARTARDEATKLRARIVDLESTVSILEDAEPFSYDDCRDDCDGCHESVLMCDCHVTAKDARDRIRDLRDRVETGEHAIADALSLCREIRPDSVLGTSPAARLKLIEDRLAVEGNPQPAESHGEVPK